MTPEERRAELDKMDPCVVCHEKHFGPKGWGRCAADKTTELPPNFKLRASPRRYAMVMSIRNGGSPPPIAAAAEEEEECFDALDDLPVAAEAKEVEPKVEPTVESAHNAQEASEADKDFNTSLV